MEFHLIGNQGISANDLVTSFAAIMSGLVAWRQRVKDEQIKNRDEQIKAREEDIARLKERIESLTRDLEHCYDKRRELADRKLDG